MAQKRLYHTKDYEELYTKHEDTVEQKIENLRDSNIAKYRVKSIWSGDMLEVEAYPLLKRPIGKRARKSKPSSEAQQRLNEKNTRKHVTRLVHTNFTNKDLWTTWTYSDDKLPADPEQAKRDMTNFIRRAKYWLSKQEEYKDFDLKYIYVTEFDEEKKVRVHHHMITNFPDRDVLEDLWNGGGRVQTRRLQPDDFGLEGLVRYILKERKGKNTKRYTISRNMEKPKITVADSRMTRKRAERLAREEVSAQEVFERWYPNYKFNDMQVQYSDFVSGAYIYVRMKRIEPLIQTRKRE